MSRVTALTVRVKSNMAKFRVSLKMEMRHSYDIEAETKDEAEREAMSKAQDGSEVIWWDIEDVDLLDSEEIDT